jgi:ankyrin repeat protein
MKKTIIYAGLAFVAFTNIALAKHATTTLISMPTEMVAYEVTPLCNAIFKGDIATVKKFIEYGADVNETFNGMTPLMIAARYNKVEILKLLLEKGANTNTKDKKGFTALQYAQLSNATDAVAILKKA